MAVRAILLYKNNSTALRRKSDAVQAVDRRTRRLIRDLKDTLIAGDDGIGLAAPQINVHSRVIVVRLSGGRKEREPGPPFAIVNPKILDAGDVRLDFDGCLSFPGLYGETRAPSLSASGRSRRKRRQVRANFRRIRCRGGPPRDRSPRRRLVHRPGDEPRRHVLHRRERRRRASTNTVSKCLVRESKGSRNEWLDV